MLDLATLSLVNRLWPPRALSHLAKASPSSKSLIICTPGSLLLWTHDVPADTGHFKLHELQEVKVEMHWPHYLHLGGCRKYKTMFTL